MSHSFETKIAGVGGKVGITYHHDCIYLIEFYYSPVNLGTSRRKASASINLSDIERTLNFDREGVPEGVRRAIKDYFSDPPENDLKQLNEAFESYRATTLRNYDSSIIQFQRRILNSVQARASLLNETFPLEHKMGAL